LRNPQSKKLQNRLCCVAQAHTCISSHTCTQGVNVKGSCARDIFIAADKKLNLCQHFGHSAALEAISAQHAYYIGDDYKKKLPFAAGVQLERAQLHT